MVKKLFARAALVFIVPLILFIGWAGWMAFSVHHTLSKYRPEVGDVLIHSITPVAGSCGP